MSENSQTAMQGIQVQRVNRQFGHKTVLEDISLDVQPAEIFGLLGPAVPVKPP